MVRQPKKLTDCPENLRESIDWLIQVKHGNGGGQDGLEELAKALQKLIEDAIQKAETSLDDRKKELDCYTDFQHCKNLKEKIEKENDESKKSRLQSQYKDHYGEVHGSESKRKNALDDLEKRQNQVKELGDKLTIFTEKDKNTNACKDLLENLTDGLEKFLGYNKDSKGYDGTGIVYSDLDRLCDGVMSFLHGVLSGVKDDDVVVLY
ncbi:hypothetical protein, conserved [Babesia ovata]|uniref:Uncharacterized protein n=1 Tax=Babesia ovata TaxID=189622 RepID=A0A2H6KC47_9APIC|nr:uncharacterized protein BOVATA_020610 [Babesia ovata]GBE60568.1 hypothetical protein, conserved [Babesia ovata]